MREGQFWDMVRMPSRKDTLLSEKPVKNTYCMVSLICGISGEKKAKFIETQSRKVVDRSWGVGEIGTVGKGV